MNWEKFDIHDYIDRIFHTIAATIPTILLAIVSLFLGLWLINKLTNLLKRIASKQITFDPTVRDFILSLINVGLKVLLLISIASKIGFHTSSLVAVLGAASFAVGLALQGSLSNFSSGVLILLFRPYKVNDIISVQGFTGKVTEIQIFNTILKTIDSKRIILPNRLIMDGPIVNNSGYGKIRVDMVFRIRYEDDLRKVKIAIRAVAKRNEMILTDPPIEIKVGEWGENSIKLEVCPWCESDNYWEVYYYMHEQLKSVFEKIGISTPYTTINLNVPVPTN